MINNTFKYSNTFTSVYIFTTVFSLASRVTPAKYNNIICILDEQQNTEAKHNYTNIKWENIRQLVTAAAAAATTLGETNPYCS